MSPTAPPPEKKPITNYCLDCGLIHLPLIPCSDAMKSNMKSFLLRIGKVDNCRGCGVTIFWVHHLNGAKTPYTEAGLNHFIDCPRREAFKRK